MMLIGISGKIGSGKDTIADMLKYHIENGNRTRGMPHTVLHVQFAGKVKQIVALLTGCSVNMLNDQSFKKSIAPPEWNRTVKDARQWLIFKNHGNGSNSEIEYLSDDEILKLSKERGFVFERTYRELLQEVGTNLFREQFIPDVWVHALFADYKPIPGERGFRNWGGERGAVSSTEVYPKWIVTDVRFPNEAKAIKDHGGLLIRINRDAPCLKCKLTKAERRGSSCTEIACPAGQPGYTEIHSHPSEVSLDKYEGFDLIVDNNGTLEELNRKALEIVNNYNLK